MRGRGTVVCFDFLGSDGPRAQSIVQDRNTLHPGSSDLSEGAPITVNRELLY